MSLNMFREIMYLGVNVKFRYMKSILFKRDINSKQTPNREVDTMKKKNTGYRVGRKCRR